MSLRRRKHMGTQDIKILNPVKSINDLEQYFLYLIIPEHAKLLIVRQSLVGPVFRDSINAFFNFKWHF